MRTISVSVKGITPLLYDRPIPEQMLSKTKRKGDTSNLPLDLSLHKNGHGVFIPFEWLDRSLKNASKRFKEPGRRGSSYYKTLCGSLTIMPEEIQLNPSTWENKPENILGRFIKRKDGNRIYKESPMFREWAAELSIEITDDINTEVLREILMNAGRLEGIGAWRPACGGRFGKFEIAKFK